MGNGQSIIHRNYKLVRHSDKKGNNVSFSLYDLKKDHAEQKNIIRSHAKLANELKTLLLDERVLEPHGFANTYHHWTGQNGATTSSANNWSDYEYANAGITYMTDNGGPGVSAVVVAQIERQNAKVQSSGTMRREVILWVRILVC